MRPLSPRQLELLRFIDAYVEENRYPPSIREIADARGVTSTNGVAQALDLLQRKGLVWRAPGRSRGLRVTELGRGLLAAMETA